MYITLYIVYHCTLYIIVYHCISLYITLYITKVHTTNTGQSQYITHVYGWCMSIKRKVNAYFNELCLSIPTPMHCLPINEVETAF